jgi:predicted XRE-type DNA-binding protein
MKTENEIIVPEEILIKKIFVLRNQKVMLDKDLAELYGVTTGNLNKAVKRNIDRFPETNLLYKIQPAL